MSPSELPHVKVESFEGPFDLLLDLAHQQKVDLSVLSLASITDDYLEYIGKNSIPMSLRAEFLVVAATLLLMKLKKAIPTLEPEEEEEVELLTERLQLYQLFQQQSAKLKQYGASFCLFAGPVKTNSLAITEMPWVEVEELQQAMALIVQKLTPVGHEKRHFRSQGKSLAECRDLLRDRLARLSKADFHNVVAGETRDTVAISFLAILELMRYKEVTLKQDEHFSSISIKRNDK